MKRSAGVEREQRLSDEGLLRLRQHLERGSAINSPVLAQWIRRYGDAARELIREHGCYEPEFDQIPNPP